MDMIFFMKSKDGPKKRHPVKISNFQRKVEHHQTVLTFGMEESGTVKQSILHLPATRHALLHRSSRA